MMKSTETGAIEEQSRPRRRSRFQARPEANPLETRTLMAANMGASLAFAIEPTTPSAAAIASLRADTASSPQVDYGLAQIQAQQTAAPTLALDSLDDPNDDRVVLSPRVKLVGTAEPGARVFLDAGANGRYSRATTADEQGEYSFEVRLRPGATEFVAAVRTTDDRGRATFDRSEVLTVRRLTRLSNGSHIQTIATGLDSPRGLRAAPNGQLYIALAGRGGDLAFITGPDGETPLGLGNTASVVRVGTDGGPVRTVLGGLPSLATADGEDANGANDIVLLSRNRALVLTGLGADPQTRVAPLGNSALGQLISLNGRPARNVRAFSDIAALEQANNIDGGEVDSNPFGVIRYFSGFAVADAGANALHILSAEGQAIESIVLPPRLVSLPNNGEIQIPMQAVPTSLAQGPDDAIYVGQLTGFPFPTGGAQIFRVVPGSGNPPEVFLTGFTHIIKLAFAPNGDLLVLQYSDASILAGNPSASLIRVAANGERTTIIDQLSNPTGLTVTRDGTIYVADDGFIAGRGRVLRIS